VFCSLALVAGLWLASCPVRADVETLNAAVLKKVKAATVHLEVNLPNGKTVEGSGFFTDEPGVIVTNAHVLGMRDVDSRPPVKIAVTVRSGEADSRTLPARLLGVDRDSDLAVLRVEGKDLPEAIPVVPAKDLIETADVFIFGFPLGKRLGKNITVGRSSVTSLRKQGGALKEIQVNGGIHPGNSGGPVVNGKGEVVGVAVSAIHGTALHFAIPGETVQGVLNGKLVSVSVDLGWKDGDVVKMPYRLVAVDPLRRIRKMTVETWVAPRDPKRPPSVPGKPQPGDTERKTIPVKYEFQPVTSVELTLPPPQEGKAYWIQPSYVTTKGVTYWRNAWSPPLGSPLERKTLTLRYQPRLGHTQPVELETQGSFKIQGEHEEHTLAVNSKSTLAEQSAAARSGETLPLRLGYRGFSLAILQDGKVIKGDDDLKQDINNIRFLVANVEMDGDGAVANTKADLSKVPRTSREFLEPIGDQLLQGLELVAVPLPKGDLKPLQTWNVQRIILLGVPQVGLGVQAQADIKYTYLGTRLHYKREIAFLNVTGRMKGVRGDGLGVGGKIEGGMQVALDTGEVLSSTMDFKAEADVKLKGGDGKLFGTLKVQVKRDVPPPAPKSKKE
jgi:hypothetical protein